MTTGMPQAFPFYVVCDVSQSMRNEEIHGVPTPFTTLLGALNEMTFLLEGDESAAQKAHLSIVNFHDDATVTLPLTRVADVGPIPDLIEGGQTNYAAVFDLLHQVVPADCERLYPDHEVRPPVVFFLTDGMPYVGDDWQPESVWVPSRNKLAHAECAADPHRARPYVLSFGFGQAREESLCKVATIDSGRRLAFMAADGGQVRDVLKEITKAILATIVNSVARRQLNIVPPQGMRRLGGQLGDMP